MSNIMTHMQTTCFSSRRQWLMQSGCGFGALALAGLLARESAADGLAGPPASRSANPFSVQPPHFEPRAKRVIFIYMPGGPSHIDLIDP